MSPAKLTARPADHAGARGRRQVGEKYLEGAGVVDTEDGTAINVCGAGLGRDRCRRRDLPRGARGALSRARPRGRRRLLGRVDPKLGGRLKSLIDLKPGAHYGNALLSPRQRDTAMKAATELVAPPGPYLTTTQVTVHLN
jgi:hypothetical protein